MKAIAAQGETVTLLADGWEYTFTARRTWRGALKGKFKIKGDIFSTGIEWEPTLPEST